MIASNDYERQVEDVRIKVPWGHIAGKWWGSKSIRPILCIHGWQDNSGSFDPLILQLPDHISYLAIDLPGHGHSSRIGDGMIYSMETYFYTVMLICDHYRWEKVSLMAHSLGSVVSFFYASTFPNKCDMVIGFDTLKPYSNIFKLIQRHFSKGLQRSLDADVRNRQKQEPPSYTYEELLAKTKSGIFLQINGESAPYLLQRAVLPSATLPNKYYFARDNRLKATPIPMMAHDMLIMFAKNISSPYCFIKSSLKPKVENQEHYDEIVQIMSKNLNFEIHSVDGDHHVHLNDSAKVSGIVSTFINKYRPREIFSKL
ncbi:probable serine hydrolase isoform X2 [Bradysia coprophila]|uniref:probable serine hydrolase isoform X2 n=1 Tax=Bradysia coprophila TaxID=38358 RepID=UPI00187D8FB1|nr:probable serine hydrolase isoform X2 [Bradysia coprophila]XP_037035041.1 probable serine hydrolase isoform X2 [Bradysia coprophila]